MHKSLRNIALAAIALAGASLASSCEDSKSYAELLDDEIPSQALMMALRKYAK